MASAGHVEQAYLDACLAELAALKPGNVHKYAAGHDMTVTDFETSARVTAPVMAASGLTIGRRIHEAIRRTRQAVANNTNLGIVLLCAPLAQAALEPPAASLRRRLEDVLKSLTVDDAEQAFAAIRLANPGGLGTSGRHDVRDKPTVTLQAAMAEARDRDRIAAQYCSNFADIFGLGLGRLAEAEARWPEPEWRTTALYLGFLAAFPDSHIRRKFDDHTTRAVMTEAQQLERRFWESATPSLLADLEKFDRSLKDKGINPGTSADLTVATLFVWNLG
jgi:triphosphoribosyl-dephospho-CoA synthase